MSNTVAEYFNAETAVRSVVVLADDGLFDVAAFDTEVGMMIESRHSFPTFAAANAYAAKFVSEVVGAGVSVPV